ncbi:MAG TPA: ABC transporter permease [Aggregatilineales bacterium]|nr:ABC transporter permease [Aggregatilineales bacterium]
MALEGKAANVLVPVRSPAMVGKPLINVEAIYGIWLRDIKKFSRERSRLLGGIARPILWLLIFGAGLRNSVTIPGVDYQHYIFPGVLGMTLIFAGLQSATSIIWDREFGFLKEVLASPVDRTSIVIGKALGGASQATLQGIITLAFAPLINLWPTPLTILELLPMMFLVAFALTSLGIVIASKMSSFEGFGTISNFVIMPMYFLSGAIFSTSSAPAWIKPFVIVNPLSYGVDALRYISIGIGTFPLALDVAFLIVFALIMNGIALYVFRQKE